MSTRGVAKRAREEHLTESSKRAKQAVGEAHSFHIMRTRSASSAKRARDEELISRSKRTRPAAHPDPEEPRTRALSSGKKAREANQTVLRVRKRPFCQSQDAGDSRAVSEKATSVPEQEIGTTIPKNSLGQPEEEQLHPLSKRRKLESEEAGEATSPHQQEVKTVPNSFAQSEEEQLHPLSEVQKLGSEEEAEATAALHEEYETTSSESSFAESEDSRLDAFCILRDSFVQDEEDKMDNPDLQKVDKDATLESRLADLEGTQWHKGRRRPKPCNRPVTKREAKWEARWEARQAERDEVAPGRFSYDSDSEEHEILVDEAESRGDESESGPGGKKPGSQPKSLEGPAITRELQMRFRKAILGLPKDHWWGQVDWRDFMVLNSKKMAEELQVPQDEVDAELFPGWGDYYPQRPLPFSDSDLCSFVANSGSALNAGMFRRIFGKSAEEFARESNLQSK